jgi:L-lactate dehydrogenase complex protein LldG
VRVGSRGAALRKVLEVLAREQVADAPGARAVWREGALLSPLDRPALKASVPGLSFEVTRESAAQSRVGVTELEWAIAETGTLAQDATDPALRLASSLPETHVALIGVGSLVPDLAALLARVDPRRMRYLALVTGPSPSSRTCAPRARRRWPWTARAARCRSAAASTRRATRSRCGTWRRSSPSASPDSIRGGGLQRPAVYPRARSFPPASPCLLTRPIQSP